MSPSQKRRARLRASLLLTAAMIFGGIGLWFATKEMWIPDLSVMRGETLAGEPVTSFPTRTLDDFRSYPFIHRAYALMMAGEYAEAEIYLARARQANPARAETWLASAQAALQRGDARRAEAFADRAVAASGGSAQALLYRAIARDVAGEVVAARADYAAALSAGGLTAEEKRLASQTLGRR